jgi:hypothetical protein
MTRSGGCCATGVLDLESYCYTPVDFAKVLDSEHDTVGNIFFARRHYNTHPTKDEGIFAEGDLQAATGVNVPGLGTWGSELSPSR